ncbi:13292_t:CDS:2 [Cetraspora pellucida]|uniref:13292_t:CDS:1 n=1 Tax=Cetraspora pellucida TaxID=1433469 RepID=A0ACA9JZP2_9GLOM|nr:13292_t:CDS:2 [Cetraspora pellucida]
MSRLSGLLLFGLQLQILKNIRESRTGQYSIKPISQNLIKRVNKCSESTLNRRAKNIATMIKDEFIQSSIFKYHNQDSISLKSFKYTVDNQIYYLSLAAIDYHLPCENIIAFERNNLTQKITKDIPIKLVDMNKAINNLEINEESDKPDDNSIDFNKVLNSIGIGGQPDCKGILKYLIPYLVLSNRDVPLAQNANIIQLWDNRSSPL